MDKRSVRLLIAMILCCVGLFLTVALLSFHPRDRSSFYISTDIQTVKNMAGAPGAYVAAFFLYLFGSAAFLWIPFLFFASYVTLRKEDMHGQWERFLAFIAFIFCSAAYMHLHAFDPLGVCPGGYIGLHSMHLLSQKLDWFTLRLFLYSLLLIALVLCMQCAGISFVHRMMRFIVFLGSKRFWRPLSRALVTLITMLSMPFFALRFLMHRITGKGHFRTSDHTDLDVEDEVKLHDLAEGARLNASVKMQTEDEFVFFEDDDSAKQKNAYEENDELFYQAQESEQVEQEPSVHCYALPGLDIFVGNEEEKDDPKIMQDLQDDAQTLEDKLKRFGVNGSIVSIKRGPVVTLFEYHPDIDSKISKIIALEDDLALALQALSIRIIAPIPGKPLVGFEVSNRHRKGVYFADVIKSQAFQQFKGGIPLVLGYDTVGNDVVVDLIRMPHLLVAGSTGSGKSVALNAMLVSMLCRKSPEELRLVLIDPKRLEFSSYADIAHLLFPIVTQPKKAAPVLKWVVTQMEERYEMMAEEGARHIQDYNLLMERRKREKLPYIVVVIDELADLMMTAGREIEDLIARITQMARAAGIHLIVATQRPSVDVITGLIKVNFPSRISFRVTSKIDSRTILDCSGADKLLGRGDMLFLDPQGAGLCRLHGAYVSDREIISVVDHIKGQRQVHYLNLDSETEGFSADIEKDEMYDEIVCYLQEIEEVSISLLQRKFKIGYNRSARIIDMLESEGFISPAGSSKTRTVIRHAESD